MRITLYNRWLSILGGGERYTFELALALAAAGQQVELLAHESLDPRLVEQRLGLNIEGLELRMLPSAAGWSAVSEASAGYDLFINLSHGDLLPGMARRNWLVVFFPETILPDAAAPGPVLWRGGYAEERDGQGRPFRWLAPQGALWLPPGVSQEVTLLLERPSAGRLRLERGDRAQVFDLPTGRLRRVRFPLPQEPAAEGLLLRWQADALPLEDQRSLALRMLGVELGRRSWLQRRRSAVLPPDRPDPRMALMSYQRLLAISDYVAGWTRRRWGRSADLLAPPVPQYAPGSKRRWILSVGRFFRGLHTKRQDALIASFRLLHQQQPGWELHLAGGLDQANQDHCAYVADLQRSAAGLPVHFHINLAGDRLAELYAGATCYWHAAGYGSRPEEQPEAQEHFGISTLEAMSAGCVPLVYQGGGPAEVVRPGVDGLHWRTPEDLALQTASLLSDHVLYERLCASARRRAAEYSPAAFAARAVALLGSGEPAG